MKYFLLPSRDKKHAVLVYLTNLSVKYFKSLTILVNRNIAVWGNYKKSYTSNIQYKNLSGKYGEITLNVSIRGPSHRIILDDKIRLHRILYATPIYVPCVQFCNGVGKDPVEPTFFAAFPFPLPFLPHFPLPSIRSFVTSFNQVRT